uniref:Uncharacterized protein n=1 Tax=Arion vulgaris TaxID=1028688 RepID=A0A0B7A575_9EUPU
MSNLEHVHPDIIKKSGPLQGPDHKPNNQYILKKSEPCIERIVNDEEEITAVI